MQITRWNFQSPCAPRFLPTHILVKRPLSLSPLVSITNIFENKIWVELPESINFTFQNARKFNNLPYLYKKREHKDSFQMTTGKLCFVATPFYTQGHCATIYSSKYANATKSILMIWCTVVSNSILFIFLILTNFCRTSIMIVVWACGSRLS